MRPTKPEIQARVDAANEFIRVIASSGRKFFAWTCEDGTTVGRISRDGGGACYYHNEWNGKKIYVSRPGGLWRGFHHGGTLRSLIQMLVKFIRDGRQVPRGFFGSHWGYSSHEMSRVVDEGKRLGVISAEYVNDQWGKI